MDVDLESRPVMHHPRTDWHDHPGVTPFPTSPPQTAFPSTSSISQRRRSSAAHARPSGPPPNLPIPSLPASSQATTTVPQDGPSFPTTRINGRAAWSTSYARPSASSNLSAVAAFSQTRQATSSSSQGQLAPTHSAFDDLSDSPPQSFLPSTSSSSQSPNRNREGPSEEYLHPQPDRRSENRSEHKPSSRRALTRALELAREAVQLDSTNDNPEAAVNAYAQSVALLSEVMERVRRGEDSTDHRRRRRRSVAAQEEEVRRLQNIHDTYADRMNILSIIYSIPAVPYTTSSMYSSMSTDSTTSNSPTNSASPSSDNSPQIPQQAAYNGNHAPDESLVSHEYSSLTRPHDAGSVYVLDETVLSGASIAASNSTSQHPYAAPYEPPQVTMHQPRSSILLRRSRASSNLPPPPPPPSNSLPPAPLVVEPLAEVQAHHAHRPESLMRPSTTESTAAHRISGSGLAALEEENDDLGVLESQTRTTGDRLDSRIAVAETSRMVKRDSLPLPPLPSPPASSNSAPGTPRTSSFITKPPPSPRLANLSASRPRGTSQLTTRSEITNQSQQQIINTTTTQGTIYQRRTKTSAPPSTRSASPAESTTSAGSVPQPKSLSLPSGSSLPVNAGRSRSSSQPGRRPSLVGGRISPPPLPNNSVNGSAMRKASFPSKLNFNPSTLQLDSLSAPLSNIATVVAGSGFSGNLPTTPTSPLPPIPPSDPLLKPYHMMNLLRNTMTSATGGYVTRRLHVPCEVWSQGGAKLSNVVEKVRVVAILCSALEDLQLSSSDYFGAGNVSSGLALGIGSIGRKEADAWLSKLEDFSNVCDGVVANFGKKLGVGEGFVLKKTTWGDKLTRRFDKFTNGKNLDSPAAYVQGLKKLFSHAQLLDEHTRAVISHPLAPAYAAFPIDVRTSAEQKLKRSSEFFATVVLTFVIRDLSQLLDKYAKKCEKWLAE